MPKALGALLKRVFPILAVMLLLAGCDAKFDDASQSYSAIIGTQFQIRGELYIFGLPIERGNNKDVRSYVIHPPPGIAGRDLISKARVPVGTKFEIIKVQKCSNCFPFPSYNKYVLRFSNGMYSDAPVYFTDEVFSEKGRLWL